ncbi:unnamed protein product [Amaranthus hypochondriacus]
MSSDMFMFDEADYSNLATNMISHDGNFFTDPISSLSDSSIDTIFQEFPDELNKNNNTNYITNSITTTQSLDQIISINSPPSQQLQTLSLQQQQTHYANMLSTDNYSVISESVKTEDFQMGFDYPPSSYSYTSFFVNSNSYDDGESMLKFMQRSSSSNCFKEKPSYWFQSKFNALMEVQNYQPEIQSSLCNGQIRRVCSTGDLPVGNQLSGGEGNMEEPNFKVGKYSAEERKERIDRYRAKRTLRNFNKTIKYACRKTLADNRPRIRGRFARNDETGEIPKNTCFNRYEDDDDPWVDNLQEDDGGLLGLGRGGRPFLSHFGVTNHFQYCGY